MEKRVKRVYVDMSVFYGAPAKEFSHDSKVFWDTVRRGEIILIVSDVLDAELRRAPAYVQRLFDLLPESHIEHVVSTDASDKLAAEYIAQNVVGESSLDDCKHIALATITRADALVSWNFKHIVNRREGYNDVNDALGYPKIKIQSPNQKEVQHDETSN